MANAISNKQFKLAYLAGTLNTDGSEARFGARRAVGDQRQGGIELLPSRPAVQGAW